MGRTPWSWILIAFAILAGSISSEAIEQESTHTEQRILYYFGTYKIPKTWMDRWKLQIFKERKLARMVAAEGLTPGQDVFYFATPQQKSQPPVASYTLVSLHRSKLTPQLFGGVQFSVYANNPSGEKVDVSLRTFVANTSFVRGSFRGQLRLTPEQTVILRSMTPDPAIDPMGKNPPQLEIFGIDADGKLVGPLISDALVRRVLDKDSKCRSGFSPN